MNLQCIFYHVWWRVDYWPIFVSVSALCCVDFYWPHTYCSSCDTVIIKSLISRAILKYVPFYWIKCMIFVQLIFRKIINFVATRCRILRLKFTKFNFGWGSAPDPAGGAYSAPPDSLAGGEGARCPLPKNPTPALGPSGLAIRPFGPQLAAPHFESFRGPCKYIVRWWSLQINFIIACLQRRRQQGERTGGLHRPIRKIAPARGDGQGFS